MPSCFAPGCHSGNNGSIGDHILRIHNKASPDIKQQWVENVPAKVDALGRVVPFDPANRKHMLCHLHFDPRFVLSKSVLVKATGKPRARWGLRKDAVPTIFDLEEINKEKCVIPWCPSEHGEGGEGIVFFPVPRPTSSKPKANSPGIIDETRKLWWGIIRILKNDPNWSPSRIDRICSRHMKPRDLAFFEEGPRLRWSAVPSLHLKIISDKSSPVPSVRLRRSDPTVEEALKKTQCLLCYRTLCSSLKKLESQEMETFLACCLPTKGIEVTTVWKNDDSCCVDCARLVNQVCTLKSQMDEVVQDAAVRLQQFLTKATSLPLIDTSTDHPPHGGDCHDNGSDDQIQPHHNAKAKRPTPCDGNNENGCKNIKRRRVNPTANRKIKFVVVTPKEPEVLLTHVDDIKQEVLEDGLELEPFNDEDFIPSGFDEFAINPASAETESSQIPVKESVKKKPKRTQVKSTNVLSNKADTILSQAVQTSGEIMEIQVAEEKPKKKPVKATSTKIKSTDERHLEAVDATHKHKSDAKTLYRTIGRNYPFKCYLNNCERSYKYSELLLHHQRRDHFNQRPFTCTVCQKSYLTLIELKKHKLWSHPDEGAGFPCREDNCTEVYKTMNTLRKHLSEGHGNSNNDEVRLPVTPCPICGYASTNDRSRVMMHIRKMHPSHQLVHCFKCNSYLVSTEELESHQCKTKYTKKAFANKYFKYNIIDEPNLVNEVEANRVQCMECKFSFLSGDDLKSNHLNADGSCPDPSAICDVCGQSCPAGKFSVHMSNHRCLYDCESIFNNPSERLRHMVTVHSYKPPHYRPRKSRARGGITTAEANPRVFCPECKAFYVSNAELCSHLTSEGRCPDLTTVCDLCGKTCLKGQFTFHMNRHYCPQRCDPGLTFMTVAERNAHVKEVHKASSSSTSKASSHSTWNPRPRQRTVPQKSLRSWGRDYPFKCDFEGCQCSYKYDWEMKQHKRSYHLKERPYPCDKCDSYFFLPNMLTKHRRNAHPEEGDKVFPCDWPGCGESFAYRWMVKNHKARAHEKHPCPLCDKSFAMKDYLRQHIAAVHNGEKNYQCSVCHQSFHYRQNSYPNSHACLAEGVANVGPVHQSAETETPQTMDI